MRVTHRACHECWKEAKAEAREHPGTDAFPQTVPHLRSAWDIYCHSKDDAKLQESDVAIAQGRRLEVRPE